MIKFQSDSRFINLIHYLPCTCSKLFGCNEIPLHSLDFVIVFFTDERRTSHFIKIETEVLFRSLDIYGFMTPKGTRNEIVKMFMLLLLKITTEH